MSRLVNINGHIVPAEQANISAYDHGFLYGDGVYETLRTYQGVPFLLDGHLARLRRSAGLIRIDWERLLTPPLAAGILDGLTREHVISLCLRAGIPCEETDIRPEELLSADECFLTSTTRELVPIVLIDGRSIGSGKPGPLTKRLLALFRAAVKEATGGHARG